MRTRSAAPKSAAPPGPRPPTPSRRRGRRPGSPEALKQPHGRSPRPARCSRHCARPPAWRGCEDGASRVRAQPLARARTHHRSLVSNGDGTPLRVRVPVPWQLTRRVGEDLRPGAVGMEGQHTSVTVAPSFPSMKTVSPTSTAASSRLAEHATAHAGHSLRRAARVGWGRCGRGRSLETGDWRQNAPPRAHHRRGSGHVTAAAEQVGPRCQPGVGGGGGLVGRRLAAAAGSFSGHAVPYPKQRAEPGDEGPVIGGRVPFGGTGALQLPSLPIDLNHL